MSYVPIIAFSTISLGTLLGSMESVVVECTDIVRASSPEQSTAFEKGAGSQSKKF